MRVCRWCRCPGASGFGPGGPTASGQGDVTKLWGWSSQGDNHPFMLRNYFKTAVRNLWKNKGFSAINILGLAIGLATCLLILIYVKDELSYDRWNVNANRIYRVDNDIRFAGTDNVMAVAPAPTGPAMLRDYPEVEKEMRFRTNGGRLVKKGNLNIQEDAVVMADSVRCFYATDDRGRSAHGFEGCPYGSDHGADGGEVLRC